MQVDNIAVDTKVLFTYLSYNSSGMPFITSALLGRIKYVFHIWQVLSNSAWITSIKAKRMQSLKVVISMMACLF